MDKDLLRVDVNTTLYIFCEPNPVNVLSEVSDCIQDHIDSLLGSSDIFSSPIKKLTDIDDNWLDQEPYGDTVEAYRSCFEIWKDKEEFLLCKAAYIEADKMQDKFLFYNEVEQK